MPMIFLFYILAPFYKIISNRFLVMWFVVFFLVSIFTNRPIGNLNPLFSFLHFSGFYVFGILCAKNKEWIISRAGYLFVSLCLVLYLGLDFWFAFGFLGYQEKYGFIDNIGLFNPVQAARFVLVFLVWRFLVLNLNQSNLFLAAMAKYSFGLFFVHGFFMLFYLHVTSKYFSPGILHEIFIVFGLALGVTVLLKSILQKRSRYVIGC